MLSAPPDRRAWSMFRTLADRVFAALCAVAVAGTSVLAQVNPEAEPNETKATATLASSGGAGMLSGHTITGTTTGSATTAGATSLDEFRLKTRPTTLGIYRHQLAITSTT